MLSNLSQKSSNEKLEVNSFNDQLHAICLKPYLVALYLSIAISNRFILQKNGAIRQMTILFRSAKQTKQKPNDRYIESLDLKAA
ncbi:MAG TPA: hypothetical protein VGF79_11080 [Bacteroidia bacterium]